MKITIEERINKAGDKKSIRLVYWNGSYTDKDGKLKHNRKREQLDEYLYVNPKTETETKHNEETLIVITQRN